MKGDRILIVDDEADIALILKLQLEDAGYRTERARDGLDALDHLSRGEYALMLLDIKMPRMDGMAVLAKVSQDYPDLAVVMMTAHGSEDIVVQALQKGATDYIAKPFSTDDMLKRVERSIQFNRTRLENLRLQKQLDVERQKMEVVLQGMADLLVAIDTEGRIMTVNRRAEDVLGKSREELLGKPVQEVIAADIGADLIPCRLVLVSHEPCLDISYQLILGTTRIPVLSSATPLVNGAGELVGSVEILRDISTLKALEQEREDFVSMLSHDLKSPITAILGSLDLVREARLGPVNEEQREYLESAVESCSEMTDMIDTLLDVHKFEAGKMVLVFREEEPPLLVQKILARFRSLAHRTRINLHITCNEPVPGFRVDRQKFSRLINNLLSNAFKFTPDGGEIEVRMEELPDIAVCRDRIPPQTYPPSAVPASGRYLQLTVRDTGEGMPAEALGTIFDRFVQAKNRRLGKTRGTGLGLAFCRKVMDAHGGFIWAESQEGQGSTLFLLFPLDEA